MIFFVSIDDEIIHHHLIYSFVGDVYQKKKITNHVPFKKVKLTSVITVSVILIRPIVVLKKPYSMLKRKEVDYNYYVVCYFSAY